MNTCPDTFICPVRYRKDAILRSPPALADCVTNTHYQHSSLREWLNKLSRNALIYRASQCEDYGVFVFEECVEDFFFKRGVKAAYHNFICLANHLCPANGFVSYIIGSLAGGEECDQRSVEQLFVA